jgi:hypothetical protein
MRQEYYEDYGETYVKIGMHSDIQNNVTLMIEYVRYVIATYRHVQS